MPIKKQEIKSPLNTYEKSKKTYAAPIFEINFIVTEFDLAITSSRIIIGGEKEHSPQVDEWDDSEGKTINVDF